MEYYHSSGVFCVSCWGERLLSVSWEKNNADSFLFFHFLLFSFTLSDWLTYLMDAKVGIGVEVVVPWRHFLWTYELGNLASTSTGSQGRYMRRMRDAGHVMGCRHWFGQWGRLGWLGVLGCDGLLPLLRSSEKAGRESDLEITDMSGSLEHAGAADVMEQNANLHCDLPVN